MQYNVFSKTLYYWSIFGSFWFCIFGSGMWPSSLRVQFGLFTFCNIADTPQTRGSECKQSYGYDTQKTMFAAATVVPCRLKWEGWLCVMLCVYYSVRRIFFQRLLIADRTNLSETSRSDNSPGLFFCSLFFSAELLNVGCVYYKKWKMSAVSTTDWTVETQLCKLRGTSDTCVGRAYSIFHL